MNGAMNYKSLDICWEPYSPKHIALNHRIRHWEGSMEFIWSAMKPSKSSGVSASNLSLPTFSKEPGNIELSVEQDSSGSLSAEKTMVCHHMGSRMSFYQCSVKFSLGVLPRHSKPTTFQWHYLFTSSENQISLLFC